MKTKKMLPNFAILSKATIAIFLFIIATTANSQNIIVNGTFDNLAKNVGNPKGYCHKPGTSDWGGYSPAERWTTWINNPTENSCMITEVVNLKSTGCLISSIGKSGVEGNVMHVVSTIGHSGIAQNPLPKNNGVKVSCWVYVVRGGMTIGVLGTDNARHEKTAASTTTCKWEQLSFIWEKPVGNITIYSNYSGTQPAADGAEFYIDNIVVEKL